MPLLVLFPSAVPEITSHLARGILLKRKTQRTEIKYTGKKKEKQTKPW